MKKLVFYKLSHSVDKKIIGSTDSQISDFVDQENNSRERSAKYREFYYDYLTDDFDLMKFCGDRKAKPTDILNSRYLRTSGLFISNEFVTLLEKFSISCYKYREVYIKYLSEKKTYFYLNLIMCPLINFTESSFVISDKSAEQEAEEIKLYSLPDFIENVRKLQKEKNYRFTIEPKKLTLNKSYDLFMYELFGTILISEALKLAIEKSDLTGYSIELFDTDFYLQ